MSATTPLPDDLFRTDVMLDELRLLVEHETPTGDVDRLDRLGDVLGGQWERLGATVARHQVADVGTHLEMVWPGPPGTPGGHTARAADRPLRHRA